MSGSSHWAFQTSSSKIWRGSELSFLDCSSADKRLDRTPGGSGHGIRYHDLLSQNSSQSYITGIDVYSEWKVEVRMTKDGWRDQVLLEGFKGALVPGSPIKLNSFSFIGV